MAQSAGLCAKMPAFPRANVASDERRHRPIGGSNFYVCLYPNLAIPLVDTWGITAKRGERIARPRATVARLHVLRSIH
jgi:hypothetical protein